MKYPSEEIYDRQVRVFGNQGQSILSKQVVGIVGLGGLGSILFLLLVRLGVLIFKIIDPDYVEPSNLNRLAGSTMADVKNKTPKVEMLKRYAKQINPHVRVLTIQASMHDKGTLDHLKNCSIIFGGTDNNSTRWILNIFAQKYLIPYFDMGTGIQADSNGKIVHAGGQVRIVIPDMGCLNCINGIDISIAQQELMPEPDRQVAIQQGYIAGADVHAPAVASLNGVIANLAATEFTAYVTGLRKPYRYIFYDFLHAKVETLPFEKDPDCFICSNTGYLATGDNGLPLETNLLINDNKKVKGDHKMQNQNLELNQAICELLANAQSKGMGLEGSAEGLWIMMKNIKLGKAFNRSTSNVLIKFIKNSPVPLVLLQDNISLRDNNNYCKKILNDTTFIKNWKPLCPAMIGEVGPDVFEFLVCLNGFLANPSLCGLMGCKQRNN